MIFTYQFQNILISSDWYFKYHESINTLYKKYNNILYSWRLSLKVKQKISIEVYLNYKQFQLTYNLN